VTELFESLKMALGALASNKMRASLTTLGVVIGVTFVLLMAWALGGLDGALEDTLSIMGDDILYVDKFEWGGGGNWMEMRNRKDITYSQYIRARDRIRTAEYVVPTASKRDVELRYGDLRLRGMTVFGTTYEYIETIGGSVKEGRFFNESEDINGAHLAIVGSHVVDNLFPNGNAVGRSIRVDGIPYTIIGTMPKRGTMMADFVDKQVIVPIKRHFSQYGGRGRVTINVKAGSREALEDVRYETIGVMRQVRSLEPGVKDDFSVNTQDAIRDQAETLRVAVAAVGFILSGLSFIVGAIGIMNIMFVSVTERTKEIGIRKAVGATRRSILTQFLIEAILLCLGGALIGYAITAAIAYFGSSLADVEFLAPTVPSSYIVRAIIGSIVVGMLAGIIPAFRAARLDPVDALRAD
jgi:putative ABC transport system permease protein